MVILRYAALRNFWSKHPETEDALKNWFEVIETNSFSTFHELKKAFNSVDAIGDNLYVFNVRGNRYRLIVRIHFRVRTVYVRFIGSHQDYDKLNIRLL